MKTADRCWVEVIDREFARDGSEGVSLPLEGRGQGRGSVSRTGGR
jgi:hypothetical protein